MSTIDRVDTLPTPRSAPSNTVLPQPRLSTLTTDTLAVTVSTLIRTGLQAALLVVIARALGPHHYAALTALFGIAMAVATLSAGGAAVVMVREVAAQRRSLTQAWTQALGCLLVSAPPLSLLAIGLAIGLTPPDTDRWAIAAICVAEVVLTPWCTISAASFQAAAAMRSYAALLALPAAVRLMAGFLLLALAPAAEHALQTWALLHVLACALAAMLCHAFARHRHGPLGPISVSALWDELRSGWGFAAGGTAQATYATVDKVMVLRLCESTQAGAYAIATRLMELATIPAWSASAALAPRLFGLAPPPRWQAPALVIGPALVAAMGVALLGASIPWLFGPAYQQAAHLTALLAGMPAIIALRIYLQLRLNTGGRQTAAASGLAIGACLNLGFNAVLLPRIGVYGAVLALLCTEAAVIVLMAITLRANRISLLNHRHPH
ncbi:Membrane protein involved in the export of O-antigen and teichoic acid [Fontimonas thermophila]|uniref:Membrane protein involved in the export of O-antigen and teichoic acid n=1 Tax=Fontimonas thermophila TaxID=1076937 RepID=A0A1I2K3F7_9GAMM|nr:lipopolysaccharide biosynthesis protein [Fontimonas thermophila]SFF60710.1 Membrane protein involved in the export of O-antigen and teichoic acid [Fontimonas thermophila]